MDSIPPGIIPIVALVLTFATGIVYLFFCHGGDCAVTPQGPARRHATFLRLTGFLALLLPVFSLSGLGLHFLPGGAAFALLTIISARKATFLRNPSFILYSSWLVLIVNFLFLFTLFF